MGGRHGKILNSLGLSRGEPRSGDPTERALFRVRSCSLDSISTAVSLSTAAQIAPNYSSSLDNLHQPWEREGTSGVPNSSREESGKKYMLLEKSSVFSSNTAVCADEQGKSELTQSLPADGARHVALHSHSQSAGIGAGLDSFSDNFVISTAAEEESRGSSGIVRMKPQLHQEQCTTEQGAQTIIGQQQQAEVTTSSLAPPPEIPLGLLQKLSQQEWNQLITFVSSTVEHTLQSAQVQRNPQQQLPLLQQSTGVRAEMEHQKTPGHRRRRKTRKERPKSLPPPYLKQDCERTEREHLQEDTEKEGVRRQRSHSHEDCYHYRCTEPVSAGYSCKASRSSSFRKNCNCRIHRCHCEHRNDSHVPVRKKRSSKSKDAPVDPSLDDNCPGLPENRVRRNRHHRQSICERCLGSLNEERRRQRHARPHSPKEDEGKEGAAPESSKDEQGSGEEEEGVDRIGYLTLDELRTAALLLRRSVGHPEDENLCLSKTREHSGGRGEGGTGSSRRRHSKSRTKHTSHEVSSVECVPSQLQPQKLAQKVDNSELVFPLKSRTGRDSPATDMAVINLDLNTPNMLAPVDPEGTADCLYQQQAYVASDSSLNNTRVVASTNGSTVQHLYLYNHHHHYHHIIHHSQP